jgi:putative tryptophan/tyrosine transport system substrate-binding protein
MKRRDFIALLSSAAVSWPVAVRAQLTNSPLRIGMLPLGLPSNPYDKSLVEAFRQGLRDVGIVENQDDMLDVVWISGDVEVAVNELIQRGAGLLVPCGSSAATAASHKSSTLPIVFISVGNPMGLGIVESLSRPGRNVTGFSDVLADLSGKYVELARELGGQQETVDYLWYTEWPDGRRRHDATEQAVQSLGAQIRSWGIGGVAGLSDAVTAIKKSGASTFIIQPSPFTYTQRARLIDAANSNRLAAIHGFPIAAREGALVAYGPDYADMYRHAGVYVRRILKGEKPADLPVVQPTKFDMVINLKTAEALGLVVPNTMLVVADEIIE